MRAEISHINFRFEPHYSRNKSHKINFNILHLRKLTHSLVNKEYNICQSALLIMPHILLFDCSNFQLLVYYFIFRSLYKQKRYPEALEKTKVALSMYHDAALVETVEKIKRKIAEASGVKSLDSH